MLTACYPRCYPQDSTRMLGRVMLAGVPVEPDAVAELAATIRTTGADDLASRLEGAVDDGVALLALTIDERDHPGHARSPTPRAR